MQRRNSRAPPSHQSSPTNQSGTHKEHLPTGSEDMCSPCSHYQLNCVNESTTSPLSLPGTPDRHQHSVNRPNQSSSSKRSTARPLQKSSCGDKLALQQERPSSVSLANKLSSHIQDFDQIIFSGRLDCVQYQSFHITIDCSDEVPYYGARAKPAASELADVLVAKVKRDVLTWLDRKVTYSGEW